MLIFFTIIFILSICLLSLSGREEEGTAWVHFGGGDAGNMRLSCELREECSDDLPINQGSHSAFTSPASITATITDGVVTGTVINDSGSGYVSPPTITVPSGGGGSGATFSAKIAAGGVQSVEVVNGGAGYIPSSDGDTVELEVAGGLAEGQYKVCCKMEKPLINTKQISSEKTQEIQSRVDEAKLKLEEIKIAQSQEEEYAELAEKYGLPPPMSDYDSDEIARLEEIASTEIKDGSLSSEDLKKCAEREKELEKLQSKLDELRFKALSSGKDFEKEVSQLQDQIDEITGKYGDKCAWN
jgi:hypothetical protein